LNHLAHRLLVAHRLLLHSRRSRQSRKCERFCTLSHKHGAGARGARRKGAPWLKTTLVQCAWAAVKKKDSYLQAQFYRIKARRGPKKAIMAVEQAIGSTFAGIVLLIWITKGSSCTRDRSFCILGRLPSHIGLSLAPSHFLSFRQKERCGSNDECR